ncbi:hypothetical protein C7S18_14745 [Ahniella affigens]|uniref:Adhesin domain-containing protein n=1 Tax=Ahniella affigens TaxID=2021234 RepID=A0A2P1PU39_9GAMM|nr:hypothetical protein [Ahniella affigens]AVP98366.1 hypothetical protein C7S18_14745 [Ahniella affigens]
MSAPPGIADNARMELFTYPFETNRKVRAWHWHIMPGLALAALFLALVVAPASADSGAPDWQVRTIDARHAIAPSVQTISISNPDGDIRIRRGTADAIVIHAVAQGTAAVSAGQWSIRASRQRWQLRVPGARRVALGLSTRVDLVVLVPTGVMLDLRSRQGQIDVRKQDALIRTQNNEGKTIVTSTVALDLRSRDGPIVAALLGNRLARASRLQSRTGAIDLAISASARFALTVRACGGIAGLTPKGAQRSRCPTVQDAPADAPEFRVTTRGRFSLSRIPATN